MKRRKFLETLGASAAGVAAFSCADREEAARIGADGVSDADLAWSKAPCRYCGTGCGVEREHAHAERLQGAGGARTQLAELGQSTG